MGSFKKMDLNIVTSFNLSLIEAVCPRLYTADIKQKKVIATTLFAAIAPD